MEHYTKTSRKKNHIIEERIADIIKLTSWNIPTKPQTCVLKICLEKVDKAD